MADLKPQPSPLQTKDLQSKFAWERPERKDQAGRLVIFGGLSLKLKEVDTVFKSASSFGVGSVTALVPESLAKVFKQQDPYLLPVSIDSHFGLSDEGLKTLSEEFALADALVLADIGNNSATELKLAALIARTFKPVILKDSSINLVLNFPNEVLQNPQIILLTSLQNLQKVIKAASLKTSLALLSSSTLKTKVSGLNEIEDLIQSKIILVDEGRVLACEGSNYINLESTDSDLGLSARIAAWEIWSPKTSFLEKVFAAVNKL